MINKFSPITNTHIKDTVNSVYNCSDYTIQELVSRVVENTNSLFKEVNDFENFNAEQVEQIYRDINVVSEVIFSWKELAEQVNSLYENIKNSVVNADQVVDTLNHVSMTARERQKLLENFCCMLDYKQYANGSDYSECLRQAIADGKKSIMIDSGFYELGNIELPSNVEIFGHPHNTIIKPLNGGKIFSIKGSIKNTSWLTLDADDFGKTIESHDGTLFNENEFILLKSQRNALDENACGSLWTLGYPTNPLQVAYFGEFKQIEKIHGNTIHLRDYLIFPSYNKDATKEPTTGIKGDKTYIYSLNLKENISIHDFKVVGMSSAIVETEFARNLQCSNINYEVDNYNGNMMNYFNITKSFDCNIKNCRFDRKDIVIPTQHHYVNVYKIASSQNIHFENCFGKNATQTFDASYLPNDIVSNTFTVKNCEFVSATQTGMTTHGGTYRGIFTGNTISDCRQGLCIRTRGSIITNNNINNNYNDEMTLRYGICLYEGHAKNCIISNNQIANTLYGIMIADGGYQGEWFKGCDSIIVGNSISNCKYGFGNTKATSNKIPNNDYNITFSDNIIVSNRSSSRAVNLCDHTSGIDFTDNLIINLNPTKNSGLWCSYDVYNINAINNTFVNCSTGVFVRGLQTLTSNNLINKTVLTDRNIYRNCDYEYSIHYSLDWINESNHKNITFDEENSDTTKIKNNTLFMNSNKELCFKDKLGVVKKIQLV